MIKGEGLDLLMQGGAGHCRATSQLHFQRHSPGEVPALAGKEKLVQALTFFCSPLKGFNCQITEESAGTFVTVPLCAASPSPAHPCPVSHGLFWCWSGFQSEFQWSFSPAFNHHSSVWFFQGVLSRTMEPFPSEPSRLLVICHNKGFFSFDLISRHSINALWIYQAKPVYVYE